VRSTELTRGSSRPSRGVSTCVRPAVLPARAHSVRRGGAEVGVPRPWRRRRRRSCRSGAPCTPRARRSSPRSPAAAARAVQATEQRLAAAELAQRTSTCWSEQSSSSPTPSSPASARARALTSSREPCFEPERRRPCGRPARRARARRGGDLGAARARRAPEPAHRPGPRHRGPLRRAGVHAPGVGGLCGGDGGLANVALERVFAATPTTRWRVLLRQALDAQIPPSQVRLILRGARGELRRRRRRS
jgi:hypothetical protein